MNFNLQKLVSAIADAPATVDSGKLYRSLVLKSWAVGYVWHPDYLYTNLCFTRITRRNALLCIFPCRFQRQGRILMHVLIHLELAMQVKSALGSFAQI